MNQQPAKTTRIDTLFPNTTIFRYATVRLYGHAGADVQGAYLPKALIEADEARDPLLAGAALMAGHGWMTAAEIAEAYEEIGATLARQAEAEIGRAHV